MNIYHLYNRTLTPIDIKEIANEEVNANELVSIILHSLEANSLYLQSESIISKFTSLLFLNQKMKKFFDINGINRCSLQTVVQGSKIIVAKNNTCLYEQNSDEEGAYILLKGGIKAKANTMIDILQLKNALQNEFSIDKTDMLNDQRFKTIINGDCIGNHRRKSMLILKRKRKSTIDETKSIIRGAKKITIREVEKELLEYQLESDNNNIFFDAISYSGE